MLSDPILVKLWLDSLGLGQYYDQLQASGFTSLAQCSGLSLQSLDSVRFNLPGHKKRLFREGESLDRGVIILLISAVDETSSVYLGELIMIYISWRMQI